MWLLWSTVRRLSSTRIRQGKFRHRNRGWHGQLVIRVAKRIEAVTALTRRLMQPPLHTKIRMQRRILSRGETDNNLSASPAFETFSGRRRLTAGLVKKRRGLLAMVSKSLQSLRDTDNLVRATRGATQTTKIGPNSQSQ